MIDKDKETYIEMTKRDIDKAKVQIDKAQKMMNEQMKYMPQGGNPRGMPQMNGRDSQEMDPAEMQRMLEQMMKDMKQK